jgi:hypothetical protein
MNTSWTGPLRASDGVGGRADVPISRIVDVAPEWAGIALDDAWLSRWNPAGGVRVVLPAGSLQLWPAADDGYGSRRRLVGVLASPRELFRLSVELELADWSSEKAELTLRPLGRSRRPGWRRWYLRAGGAFTGHLASTVRALAKAYSQTLTERAA